MRWRRASRAVIILAAVLACPRPAFAQRAGLWEWLERLSGPGPFHGWTAEVPVPFVCGLTEIANTQVESALPKPLRDIRCWGHYEPRDESGSGQPAKWF